LPAVEEKKSLPDRVKKEPEMLQDGFRLHYFPNIPVDEPVVECGSLSGDREFQRSHFKPTSAPCANAAPESESEEPPPKEKGPSVEAIKENAFQKGFIEGKRVGFESGTKKVDPVINSLGEALGQLENIRKQIHETLEAEVARLALAIAKKIVCHEIKTDQETVVCVAREALSRVENPGNVKIKLHPDDLKFIKDTQSQLSHFLHNVESIRFEAEASIQSGGCLIETDLGDIDARIEKQFQAIEESFQAQFDQLKQES
jgi:flagellar biosynthesis/type III secretory pathway protein FliH